MATRAKAAARRAELAELIAEAFGIVDNPTPLYNERSPEGHSRVPDIMAAVENASDAASAIDVLRAMKPATPPCDESSEGSCGSADEHADDQTLFREVEAAMASAAALTRSPAKPSSEPVWLTDRRRDVNRRPHLVRSAVSEKSVAFEGAGTWTCEVCGTSNALPTGVALGNPRPEDEFVVTCAACRNRPLSRH